MIYLRSQMVYRQFYVSGCETDESLFCNFVNEGDEKPDCGIFSKLLI